MAKNQDVMMDMSAMMQEPHHQLAMAYKQNLENFAKALRDEAAKTATVNPEFARAAVAEMKRSFDLMQQHHQDHLKTVDDKMKAHMSDMMKQMETQDAAIKESLAGLDKEVQNSTPESKAISQYVEIILKNCDMSKMHGDMMKDPMAQPPTTK
jgi:polyhydroxyalkanoate synthesis regulator phasin